jgi:hypothetical protein
MRLDPTRRKEIFDWLDEEWESYKKDPSFGQDMDIFLTIVKSFASSTTEAYIDDWHERYQQAQQKTIQSE